MRPHLEYGNRFSVVSSFEEAIHAAVERVQRRTTKLLYTLREYDYAQRLRSLRLASLKSRRVRGDLIQAYKIINHIDDVHCSTFCRLLCRRQNLPKICTLFCQSSSD